MKRFYFGSEDEGEEEDGEGFEMPSASELIAMTQVESPFKHLMDSSIRVCERSLVWRFLSPEEKLKMINKVFAGLSAIEREYEGDADLRDDM
jgi:hypothetical protein